MAIKIKTPMGYACFTNESETTNTKDMYIKMQEDRHIEILLYKGEAEKKCYRTCSPFGYGYTDDYDRVMASERSVMKLFGENPERNISFVEVF